MKKMWIVTSSYNEYDQHGDYFVAAYLNKPTRSELLILFYKGTGDNSIYTKEQHAFISHLSNGGGRRSTEYCWYYLKEVQQGINYEEE